MKKKKKLNRKKRCSIFFFLMDRIALLPATSSPSSVAYFHVKGGAPADMCTALLEKAKAVPAEAAASHFRGAEAKGGGKVAAPICFTKESCTIRKAAVDAIKTHLANDASASARIVDVPSLICVETKEGWFNIFGENKATTPWVALVALGPIDLTFLNHERKDASVFDDVISKLPHEPGKGNPFFTQEVTDALQSDCFEFATMEAGDIFITHRGMPLWVIGDGGFQLVHTRILAPNSQIHEAYAKTLLDKGILPSAGHFGEPGLLHDVLVAKNVKGFEEAFVPSCQVALPEEVPWLTTKEASKKAKKAPAKREPEEPATREEIETSIPAQHERVSGAEKQIARHTEIEARIAKLNGRVWDDKSETKAREHRSKHIAGGEGFVLTSYKRVLDTLEENVKRAEEMLELVPEFDQKLLECKKLQACLGKGPEVTLLNKDLRKFDDNTLVTSQRKEKLEELLERAKKLMETMAFLHAKKSEPAPKARPSNASSAPIDVPEVKRESCEPYIPEGDEAKAALDDMKWWSEKKFLPMVMHHQKNSPKIAALFDEYQKEVRTLREGATEDFGYAFTMFGLLKNLYEDLSAKRIQEKKQEQAEAAAAKGVGNGRTRVICQDNEWGTGCGEKLPMCAFGQCKKCFRQNVETEAAWLNDCALDLHERANIAKAEREAENAFVEDVKTELEEDAHVFVSLGGSLMEMVTKLDKRKNLIPEFIKKLKQAEEYANKYGCVRPEAMDEGEEDFVGGVEDLEDDDDEDEEEEDEEEDDSIVCGDDEVSFKSENSLPSESFSSSSSSSGRRKKSSHKRKKEDKEEEDDLESFKAKVSLRLFKQMRRAPNLPLVKRCANRFEKEDLQSIQWVDVNLKEVENAKECYAIMATASGGTEPTATPFMFLTEEEAEEKRQDLQNATTSIHYTIQTKTF